MSDNTEQLQWNKAGSEIYGRAKSAPDVTLFIIVCDSYSADTGRLLGAMISDKEEAESKNQNRPVAELKSDAEERFRKWIQKCAAIAAPEMAETLRQLEEESSLLRARNGELATGLMEAIIQAQNLAWDVQPGKLLRLNVPLNLKSAAERWSALLAKSEAAPAESPAAEDQAVS